MMSGIGRSIQVALWTLAVWAAAQGIYIVGFCPAHRAWQRVRHGKSEVVLDGGEGIARPGDALFACETPHTTGPLQWHLDLDCYCAPRNVSVARLSDALGGRCTVSELFPTRDDESGACRHAHCSHHVDF